MAKIITLRESKDDEPVLREEVEVRVWGRCANAKQLFCIGSGVNYRGDRNFLLEVLHSFNDVPAFYTRTFIHNYDIVTTKKGIESRLKAFKAGETDSLSIGDLLPETSIVFKRNTGSYPDEDGSLVSYSHYQLNITADVGVVLGRSGPGERSIIVHLDDIELEQGLEFMRDLYDAFLHVYFGAHPDPAAYPPGSSDWPFARKMVQIAYDKTASTYQEAYFQNPLLTKMFDTWLAKLPRGGHILDVGCGHGDPVIERLLARGFKVTGSDISPAMLQRAQEKFPQAAYLQRATTEIMEQGVYDGICSLNSLLYLDPIDLYNSLYRLHQALKPGGLLFLYAYDASPNARGTPFGIRLDQWMWSWQYGKDDAVRALEEHGYFRVLRARRVQTRAEKLELIERKKKRETERSQKYANANSDAVPAEAQMRPHTETLRAEEPEILPESPEETYQEDHLPISLPPFPEYPDQLAYNYAIIARRQDNS